MTHLLFILRLSRWAIATFLEQDLLHFSILQIVEFPHCVLSSIDQVN